MSKENQKRNDDKLEAHEISLSDSKQQKLEAGEIVVPKGKFALWWENYWYHYKFHTIVVLFAIFVCTVCFVQCSQKESGDLTVTFAGACGFENAEDRDNLIEVLNAVAPKSEQKDEKLSVLLTTYSIFSEEELRARFTDEEGKFDSASFQTAKGFNNDHLDTFGTYLMTGESPVLLTSEFVFDYQNMEEIAMPLSEIYGENLPASACNEYAVRLGDTDFYRYYKAVQILPADTLVVFIRSYVWGASADKELYADYERMFRAIVDFKIPS